MYTEEDLEKAFEAGNTLAWMNANEYEGYGYEELEYTDFNSWFTKIFKDNGNTR